jgi:histidyl-tRNA synthetase
VYHCAPASLKNQLKRADRSGARLAVIIGGEELAAGEVIVKLLRADAQQQRVVRTALGPLIESYLR